MDAGGPLWAGAGWEFTGSFEDRDFRTPLSTTVPAIAQSRVQLIETITVDAYDSVEQLSGFLQVFQDEIATPAAATVLGMAVEVTGFDRKGTSGAAWLPCVDTTSLWAPSRWPTSTSNRTRSPIGPTRPIRHPGEGRVSRLTKPSGAVSIWAVGGGQVWL